MACSFAAEAAMPESGMTLLFSGHIRHHNVVKEIEVLPHSWDNISQQYLFDAHQTLKPIPYL